MPDFENAASWDDADPPTRGVWYDAEPDTRQRGAKPAPAPRGGYRIRSDETWARARDAYLAGETAEEVAFRFDLSMGTLRERARKEGWRRADQDDPEWGYRSERGSSLHEPGAEERLDDRWGHISDDEGYASLAERALYQLRRAMAQGRGGAAASWMRVHDRLMARAEIEEARKAKAEADARRDADMAEVDARARALVDEMAQKARLRDLARAAAQSPAPASGADVARAPIDAELERLARVGADLDAPGRDPVSGSISDGSDGSHAFSAPPGGRDP
ncbi:hypothetical protein IP78_14630 [Brevundimonas sp. AAP58]|uniref:hypothetical protein n=1 Tax=Brevundimonas sp. AAP58 TaxID=1523422 RepID=UPI0006B8ADB4|nr:hypothetical protein [Brevundimonas sp. AAP58]KPF73764.1 hypothetical protein IP78_14630 [Brevundimonas sp. AAP58]